MQNKTALITGATSGLGKATAIQLADLGVNLILASKLLRTTFYVASIVVAVFIGIQIGSNSNKYWQLSDANVDENYLEIFSETQFFNDFEQETVENSFINDENLQDE